MKNCPFEKYLLPFMTNELSSEESGKVRLHIQACENCSQALAEMQDIHKILQSFQRAAAPKLLYADYKRSLARLFEPAPFRKRLGQAVQSSFAAFFISPSTGYRLARTLAILVIGMLIGRFAIMPSGAPPVAEMPSVAPALSVSDLQQLNDYFVQSELLLLTIANTSPDSRMAADDLILSRDVAKKLLLKTTTMQRKAGAINDESIMIFLNHLEFVLLEISNRKDDDVHSAFQEIREMVKEADLVQKSRQLQGKLTRSLTPGV